MRICLYTVTALPKLGGQEAVVDALARQLLAAGHQPVVLAPRPRQAHRAGDARLPYPVLRHPRLVSTRHGVSLYRRWLLAADRRRRFDIVHCHDVYPCGYLAALCRRAMQIPIVMTSHGGDIRPGNVRLAKPGMRPRFERAIASADALIAISRFTRNAMLQLHADPQKIVDIPNGVDLETLAHRADRPADLPASITSKNYLLFLGRLAPRKGIDILLAAMRMLPESPTLQLVIAGSGDEEPAIGRQIQDSGLAGRVHLIGAVAGGAKTYLLQNALATVMPSRQWEAFPLVVLESYAAGRPVIGTDIPGLADVIQHDGTGLLVPPEDPAGLAAAITRLMQNPALADSQGRSAAAFATDYDWRRITQRHIELYQRLLQAS
jgi:glycosyltransferase involved in cell wall biosynthesis